MGSINKIRSLNLFENPEETSEEAVKNQRTSTFIFLFLLVLSIVILLLYTSLTNVTKTVIVQKPSFSVYNSLQVKYPQTLVCPCTSVLNTYRKFILAFQPIFNQICSSDFISDEWINYVNYRSQSDIKYHYFLDFRHSAYSFFNMIKTLCKLTSSTISNQLIVFYTSILLTENVILKDTFNATMYASRDNFISTTANSYLTLLNSFRSVVQGNGIVNRLETNFQLRILQTDEEVYNAPTSVRYPTTGCSCSYTSLCKETTGIYSRAKLDQLTIQEPSYNNTLQFSIPGVKVGCFILDAVLASDLSCLYNSSCLSQLYNNLTDSPYPLTGNMTPLSVPSSSASLPTIDELIKNLLIDQWLFNFSYELYFAECNPSSCSYTYNQQFDIIYIITTTVGFLGGIVTILMLVTLSTVTFLRNRFKSLAVETVSDREKVLQLIFSSFTMFSLFLEVRTEDLRLSTKFKNLILNLNLFKDPEERTEWHLYNQRFSTRVFIVSMAITLAILVLFTSISHITETVIVKQPTVDIYSKLQAQYPETLICPCSSISIEYKQFISFQPTFHQICSSDFVTSDWTRYLITTVNINTNTLDFRDCGGTFFSTLAAFCNLSLETINNELFVFNSTKYVTRNVQQPDVFQSQTEHIIDLLKRSTINSFQQLLSLSRLTSIGNALFSGLLLNYGYANIDDNSSESLNQILVPLSYALDDNDSNNTCSCKTTPSSCNQFVAIYERSGAAFTVIFIIPGLRTGCFLTEAIFQSTLECFFEQNCLDTIYNLIYETSDYPFKATVLNYNSSNTQYDTKTKIQDMVNNLMVEQWNNETSFMSYFEQCNPQFCTYTYNKRGDFGYIFTITVGLIGGLTTVFRILIPPIVSCGRRKKKPLTPIVDEPLSASHTLSQKIWMSIQSLIWTLNLFKSPNKRSNEQLRRQRISTRVFIFLLSLSLVILLLFVSLDNIKQSTTIQNPTVDQFNALVQQYPNSVQCPCTTLSTEYQHFISFQPRLHAICSSAFVNTTSQWFSIDYPVPLFYDVADLFHTNIDDFRHIASPFFQFMNSSCQLSLQTISTELITFNSTTFITPNLITSEQFKLQTNEFVTQFVENTARSFINALLLVNNMTRANMLISAMSSDSILTVSPDYYYLYYYLYEYIFDETDQIYNSTLSGTECDCQQSSWCRQQAIVYDKDANTRLFAIPGIYVGCYIVEAVLQSDLRCFQNFDCLKELGDKLNVSVNESDILLLNSTLYQSNTSLLKIVSNLMVEEWNSGASYSNYFNQCQAKSCTATYISRGNIVYVLTTIITLIGGLAKVYRFIVPLVVGVVLRVIVPFIRQKFNRNDVTPVIEVASRRRISI